MSDDIVTRLRDEAQTFWDVRRFRPLWIEAADEIERLRIKLRRWEVCDMVVEGLCGWDTEETYCESCEAAHGA